jgi:hypothetical protein
MSGGRQAGSLVCPVFLLVVAQGCQAFHQYRPVAVLARDAETGKPIPGAEVRISYPLTPPSSAPWDSNGPTQDDGIARLRAAPAGEAGILLQVSAAGYLSEEKNLSVEEVEAIRTAGWFESVEKRPASFVLDLYAGPAPTVELVLPTGYRGHVKAELRVREDVPCPAGQRCFSSVVPVTGSVVVTGPSLLRRVCPLDFRARYEDGTPLSREANDAEIGFWCWKWENGAYQFLIGTRSEYEALRRSEQKSGGEGRTSGGKSSGQGKRGHKGGQSGQSGGDTNP